MISDHCSAWKTPKLSVAGSADKNDGALAHFVWVGHKNRKTARRKRSWKPCSWTRTRTAAATKKFDISSNCRIAGLHICKNDKREVVMIGWWAIHGITFIYWQKYKTVMNWANYLHEISFSEALYWICQMVVHLRREPKHPICDINPLPLRIFRIILVEIVLVPNLGLSRPSRALASRSIPKVEYLAVNTIRRWYNFEQIAASNFNCRDFGCWKANQICE